MVFFLANDGVHGKEVWVTDGTEQGTRLVKDLFSEREYSRSDNFAGIAQKTLELTISDSFFLDDEFYFHEHRNFGSGPSWRTDGTAARTVEITTQEYEATSKVGVKTVPTDRLENSQEIRDAISFSDPRNLGTEFGEMLGVGGKLYFEATTTSEDGTKSTQLWATNDDQASPLTPVRPTTGIAHLTAIDETVFYTDRSGSELWRVNENQEATLLLDGLENLSDLSVVAGELFFWSQGGTLWKTNDDSESVTRIVDELFSLPQDFGDVEYEDTYYFVQPDGLWQTDGNAAQTRLAIPGAELQILGIYDNRILALQTKPREEMLFLTDGTPEGIEVLSNSGFFNPPLSYAGISEGQILMGREVLTYFLSDGTRENTRDIFLNVSPTNSVSIGESIYVAGTHVQLGFTSEPDRVVRLTQGQPQIQLMPRGSIISNSMVAYENLVFFAFSDLYRNDRFEFTSQIWTSDGTDPGTGVVYSMSPGTTIKSMELVGDDLYFVADDGLHGTELWKISVDELHTAGIPGDTNFDQRIDERDIANLQRGFGKEWTGVRNGDFNDDGRVDFKDYLILWDAARE